MTFNLKTLKEIKPQLILGFCFFFLLTLPSKSNEQLQERLYSQMTDFNTQRAVENLLIALETKEDPFAIQKEVIKKMVHEAVKQ